MTIEQARTCALAKPWGVTDLRPWNYESHDGNAIGEIWYERTNTSISDSSLLLKLIFTSQPLSIQVHPDDEFAHSIGLPRGKSEVWYVISADPDAKVALGLKKTITTQQLSTALDDGSIAELVEWHNVSPNDIIYVPAGTIHAIGAGLVIAELQQRSDATFRMFDYARNRELHLDNAKAVAKAGPAQFQIQPKQICTERTLLVSCPQFTFERIKLGPHSNWILEAPGESWILVLSGSARANTLDVIAGDGIFVQSDVMNISAGSDGILILVAYTGVGSSPKLRQCPEHSTAETAVLKTTAFSRLAKAAVLPANSFMEAAL